MDIYIYGYIDLQRLCNAAGADWTAAGRERKFLLLFQSNIFGFFLFCKTCVCIVITC